MLRGVNRLIVEINNPDSDYFEKAIFFVRPEKRDVGSGELRNGAEKLLIAEKEKRHKIFPSVLRFILGFAAGAGGAAICFFLLK